MKNEMRLIDANALHNVFDAMHAIPGGSHFDHLVLLGIKKYIDDAPTIDAVPVVHGRWVKTHTTEENVWNCSACGYPVGIWTAWSRFCPNCGARMDGGAEG